MGSAPSAADRLRAQVHGGAYHAGGTDAKEIVKKIAYRGIDKTAPAAVKEVEEPPINVFDLPYSKVTSKKEYTVEVKDLVESVEKQYQASKIKRTRAANEVPIDQLFKMADSDKDGYITWLELDYIAQRLDFKISIEECKKVVAGLGKKKKGFLAESEFRVWYENPQNYANLDEKIILRAHYKEEIHRRALAEDNFNREQVLRKRETSALFQEMETFRLQLERMKDTYESTKKAMIARDPAFKRDLARIEAEIEEQYREKEEELDGPFNMERMWSKEKERKKRHLLQHYRKSMWVHHMLYSKLKEVAWLQRVHAQHYIPNMDIPQETTYQELLRHQRDFFEQARSYANIVVTELGLPDEEKTIKPGAFTTSGMRHDKYACNGILLEVVHGQDESRWRRAGLSVKHNYIMDDATADMVHFPLMCCVDVLGIRVKCTAMAPIGPDTLLYDVEDGAKAPPLTFQDRAHLDDLTRDFAQYFNLKTIEEGPETNVRLRIKDTGSGIDYFRSDLVSAFASCMYPSTKIDVPNSKDERVYVTNLENVFPHDDRTNQHVVHHRQLRAYDKPLCSDASAVVRKVRHEDFMDIRELQLLQKKIKEEYLWNFAAWIDDQLLEQAVGYPANGVSIKQMFSSHGISMRYMGVVANRVTRFQWKDCLAIEMAARALKWEVRRRVGRSSIGARPRQPTGWNADKDGELRFQANSAMVEALVDVLNKVVVKTYAEKDKLNPSLNFFKAEVVPAIHRRFPGSNMLYSLNVWFNGLNRERVVGRLEQMLGFTLCEFAKTQCFHRGEPPLYIRPENPENAEENAEEEEEAMAFDEWKKIEVGEKMTKYELDMQVARMERQKELKRLKKQREEEKRLKAMWPEDYKIVERDIIRVDPLVRGYHRFRVTHAQALLLHARNCRELAVGLEYLQMARDEVESLMKHSWQEPIISNLYLGILLEFSVRCNSTDHFDQMRTLAYEQLKTDHYITDSEMERHRSDFEKLGEWCEWSEFDYGGHEERVNCIEVAAEDGFLFSGSIDHNIFKWSLKTREAIDVMVGHKDSIICMALTDANKTLISGSADCTIRVWNTTNCKCVHVLKGHEGRVYQVRVTSAKQGNLLLSASEDRSCAVWDPKNGQCLRVIRGHRRPVVSVRAHPSGKMAVSGSTDTSVRVWDWSTGERKIELNGHTGEVRCVEFIFTRRSWMVLSAGLDKDVRLWDSSTGECVHKFVGHKAGVLSLLLLDDKETFLTGSLDRTVRVWNVHSTECNVILQGHSGGIKNITMPCKGLVATASIDKTVRIWELSTGLCLRVLHGFNNHRALVVKWISPRRLVAGFTNSVLDEETTLTIREWKFSGHLSPEEIREIASQMPKEKEEEKLSALMAHSPIIQLILRAKQKGIELAEEQAQLMIQTIIDRDKEAEEAKRIANARVDEGDEFMATNPTNIPEKPLGDVTQEASLDVDVADQLASRHGDTVAKNEAEMDEDELAEQRNDFERQISHRSAKERPGSQSPANSPGGVAPP